MSCLWRFLASRTTPERFRGKPGHPYCEEHRREIDAMEQTDRNWDEIFASFKALREEPEHEGPLCAVYNCRPVDDGCSYCEKCCADHVLGLLGRRGSSRSLKSLLDSS